jgi:hypothetical protein
MKTGIMPAVALAMLTVTSAHAREDCDAPTRDWKSREAVRALAVQRGWTLRRIKIEDGCYEVYGMDENGHRFEAKIDPVTLDVTEIEDHHDHR